jgi:hypothetical protein
MAKHFPVRGEVHGLRPSNSTALLGNCSFSSISFHNNHVPRPSHPSRRVKVHDVAVFRCEHWACSAQGTIFEDVTVTDIRGGGRAMSFLWGCVFSRVILRGWISGILFRRNIDPEDQAANHAFAAANAEMYQTITWALDIREAQFSFFQDLLGIPPKLILRNPDVHFVLTRESATRLVGTGERFGVWAITAQDLLASGLDETVVVVGGTGAKLKTALEEVRELRSEGFLA